MTKKITTNIDFDGLNYVCGNAYFLNSMIDEELFIHKIQWSDFIKMDCKIPFKLEVGVKGACVFKREEADLFMELSQMVMLKKIALIDIVKPDYTFN